MMGTGPDPGGHEGTTTGEGGGRAKEEEEVREAVVFM